MKNLLLLGGNGFIGKNIIEKFLPYGYNIVLLDREIKNLNASLYDKKIKTLEGDLKNTELLKEVISDYQIDTIIHLVSSMIPSSSINKYYDEIENVIIPSFKLLDLISKSDIKFIFFSSGGTIYGQSKSPHKENHKLTPINYYGYSKLIIEQYILYKNRVDKLKYLILRPSNAFGRYQPFRSDQGFIAAAANKILNDEIIEIWGDGKSVRDFIDVKSLVDALHALLELDISNEIINIGTGTGYNLLEILQIFEKILNKKPIVRFMEKRIVDVDIMILSIDKLKSLINYSPVPIYEGISNYLNSVLHGTR